MARVTLKPSSRLDIEATIRKIWDVLESGGIAICPNTVGYGIWAGSPTSVNRVFETKQRGRHKRHALISDEIGQREIQDLDSRKQDMIECLTKDHDLPVGVVAPCRLDHALLKKVDPALLRASTANGTIGMLLNGGPLHTAIGRLSREAVHPVFGSSANISGSGTKFRLEDIEPEVRAIADLEVDWGLRRYHTYGRSSTIINFTDMSVIRIGSCYELIKDVLKRQFGVDLPEDPGRSANPSGHLAEFALPAFE